MCYNNKNKYSYWSLYINWVISNNDARIKFNFTKDEEDVNKVYKAYANTFIRSKVEWIVSSNVTNWNTFKWLLLWIKWWFTWLSWILFLQDDWTYWNSQWTNIYKLWEALTSTKMFFKKPY